MLNNIDIFLLINMTNKLDYLGDNLILASLLGISLCFSTLSLMGCLILIKIYLQNLHQLIKLHAISSLVQQIVCHFVLFGAFVEIVVYRNQNWFTCALTFRVLDVSVVMGLASTTTLSIVRYYRSLRIF